MAFKEPEGEADNEAISSLSQTHGRRLAGLRGEGSDLVLGRSTWLGSGGQISTLQRPQG